MLVETSEGTRVVPNPIQYPKMKRGYEIVLEELEQFIFGYEPITYTEPWFGLSRNRLGAEGWFAFYGNPGSSNYAGFSITPAAEKGAKSQIVRTVIEDLMILGYIKPSLSGGNLYVFTEKAYLDRNGTVLVKR